MALRLIRQASDTPNVLNSDDVRMVRYAYGGYNGIVKGKGTEVGYVLNGSTLRLTSGVVVLDGWESDIDSNGVEITVDNIATKRYYAVYYEVNGALGTASIKDVYDTAGTPTVEKGDDLTVFPTGIAKMVLYTFTAESGVITNVKKVVDTLGYMSDRMVEVEHIAKSAAEKLKNEIENGTVIAQRAKNYVSGEGNIDNRFNILEKPRYVRGNEYQFTGFVDQMYLIGSKNGVVWCEVSSNTGKILIMGKAGVVTPDIRTRAFIYGTGIYIRMGEDTTYLCYRVEFNAVLKTVRVNYSNREEAFSVVDRTDFQFVEVR